MASLLDRARISHLEAVGPEPVRGDLDELLWLSAARFSDLPALGRRQGYRRDTWSYLRLLQTAWQLSSWLGGRYTLAPGDRVALCAANSPAWVATFFALLHLRAVVVPLDLRSTRDFA